MAATVKTQKIANSIGDIVTPYLNLIVMDLVFQPVSLLLRFGAGSFHSSALTVTIGDGATVADLVSSLSIY